MKAHIVLHHYVQFALVCIIEEKFQIQAPEAYIRRGLLQEVFLRFRFGGLIYGGAYTRRGLFSEFYGSRVSEGSKKVKRKQKKKDKKKQKKNKKNKE